MIADPKVEAALVQEAIKAERVSNLKQLLSPVDEVVQRLAIHTVGGVVTPAQALAVVVPAESGLEIEAMVSNRDIGFVTRPGCWAQGRCIRFHAIWASARRIISISRDSLIQEVAMPAPAGTRRDTTSRSAETETPELSYSARVSLEQTQLAVDGRLVDLAAGMTLTVEIKTGSRRIISTLLSPIARYKQEVLRER